MTPEQEADALRALESLATGIAKIEQILRQRFDREYPPEREQLHAEVFKAGEVETKRPNSPEEYEEFKPEDSQPGRFESLFHKVTK
jgi:hypothetical protein